MGARTDVLNDCLRADSCLFNRSCSIASELAGVPARRFILKPRDVFEVDAVASSLFFIERGFVRIEDRREDGDANYISFHGKGEAINLLQVFASVRATYHLTALVETSICQIAFTTALDESAMADLMYDSIDNLSLSIQSNMSGIWMLYGRSVGERVKRFLSTAALFCDRDEMGYIRLAISQSELARAVRAERASITKELKALEREGILSVVYGGISFDPSKTPRNPFVS